MKSIKQVIKAVERRWQMSRIEHRDFRTKRHIVVFESDDWGSIRMPRHGEWEKLREMGYSVDRRPYERYDTLESPQDMEALFDVLRKHRDSQGHHPVITANMLVANPDFEKIEKEQYSTYFYEPVASTYTRYFGDSHVLDLMRQGMSEGLFMPQSHGREHFNVQQWLKGLQAGDKDLHTAFRFGLCGIAPLAHPEQGNKMMVALKAETEEDKKFVRQAVDDGLRLFADLWGFPSRSFIAPCYTWDEGVEDVLRKHGVALVQGGRKQRINNVPTINHYTGERNNGLIYNIRNCNFEPATNEGGSSVGDLMAQTRNIFKRHKIATISVHRINFAGGIDESNRTRTLRLLDEYLTQLLKEYPDTEFLSSDKLAEIL